tara:strand:- start:1410 stop:3494 length:2085 start_codon:yes stop_codon:yes gene_type:complete
MTKKILLKGPLLTRSGYGEQARFALRALRSRPDLFDVYIQPLTWGTTSWIIDDDEDRKWIDKKIEKTIGFLQQGGKFDVSLQVTIPNEWEELAPINIGYTAGIETTRVHHTWVQKANLMDKIITVAEHGKQSFLSSVYTAVNEQTGEEHKLDVQTEMVAVNYPVKTYDSLPEIDLKLDYDFNFLCVAQFGPRKNLPNTLKWFVEEFHDNEVGLVVKSNISKNCLMDRIKLFHDIKAHVDKFPNRKCKVYLLHGDMTDEEMHSLYLHPNIKAFVMLPHGEGFGLPIFEAAYSGLPVVTTGWSGQLDFLIDDQGQEHFYNVAYDLLPVQEEVVWDGVLIKESAWAHPREQSARLQMRLCYENIINDTPSYKHKKYAAHLKEKFSNDLANSRFVEALVGDIAINIETDYIFVSDMFADQYNIGGAELSLQSLIDDCPDNKTHQKVNSSDGEKLAMLFNHNQDSTWVFGNIADLNNETINTIINSGVKYYFIEFDYKYCEYRNPTLYKFLEDEKCDYTQTERGQTITKFINNSVATFFMSDGQMDIYTRDLKNLESNKLSVLSSTFQDSFFDKINKLNSENKDADRTKWIVLGSRSWVKGAKESEKWCKDNNLDYEVINNISHDQLLEKLSTAKGICFKPTGLDTCPRFVIEAKLLGCELELNENVQHLNEDWFSTDNTDNIVEYLKSRKQFFWSKVG